MSTWAWSCSGKTASTAAAGAIRIGAPSTTPRQSAKATARWPNDYPNFVKIAEGFGVKATEVRSKAKFLAALAEMLAYKGPYLLDVIRPYQDMSCRLFRVAARCATLSWNSPVSVGHAVDAAYFDRLPLNRQAQHALRKTKSPQLKNMASYNKFDPRSIRS